MIRAANQVRDFLVRVPSLFEIPIAVILATGGTLTIELLTVAIGHLGEVATDISAARIFTGRGEAAIGAALVIAPLVALTDATIESRTVRRQRVTTIVAADIAGD